jgi:hypothetical protein
VTASLHDAIELLTNELWEEYSSRWLPEDKSLKRDRIRSYILAIRLMRMAEAQKQAPQSLEAWKAEWKEWLRKSGWNQVDDIEAELKRQDE